MADSIVVLTDNVSTVVSSIDVASSTIRKPKYWAN